VLNWDDLRHVLAVERAGSLIAAARALGVDKATVSRRIAAAEAALGARLFDRKPDGYDVTPHGQRVIAAVTDMDDTVATLVARLSEGRGEEAGLVHLSVPQFFVSKILLPTLGQFRVQHPAIDLVVNASSTVLNVAKREAEVGLRNVRPKQQSVTVRKVGALGMALYGSRTYFQRHGRPKTASALAEHALIGWDRAFTHARALLWVNDCGARMPIRLNDSAVMCDAVAADLGIAALPCVLGDEHPGLVRLTDLGMSQDDIYAVAPGELRRSGRVRAVIELLADVWATNRSRLAGDGG
jgi:DNA-binding transcriptional LysR family regulator